MVLILIFLLLWLFIWELTYYRGNLNFSLLKNKLSNITDDITAVVKAHTDDLKKLINNEEIVNYFGIKRL